MCDEQGTRINYTPVKINATSLKTGFYVCHRHFLERNTRSLPLLCLCSRVCSLSLAHVCVLFTRSREKTKAKEKGRRRKKVSQRIPSFSIILICTFCCASFTHLGLSFRFVRLAFHYDRVKLTRSTSITQIPNQNILLWKCPENTVDEGEIATVMMMIGIIAADIGMMMKTMSTCRV